MCDGENVHVIPTNRGREALYLCLRSLDLQPGARIGVPLYSCSVVANTILAVGLRPIFLDADPETFGISHEDLEHKVESLDGLVLVHTFGYPVDFDRVRRAMKGRPIVEDCAHALGSTYRGHKLGSLAPVAFFSFGFFKPLAAGGGGCVVTRDPAQAQRMESLLCGVPQETFPQALCHAGRCLLYSLLFRQPAYTALSHLRRENSGDGGYDSSSRNGHTIIARQLRMRQSDQNVVATRLHSWTGISNEVLEFWLQVRSRVPKDWRIPPEPTDGKWNHFLLPVCAPTPLARTKAVAMLRRHGIGAAPVYPNRAAALSAAGYIGDCLQAERLAASVFMLPAHADLSAGERERILQHLALLDLL